MELNGKTALVTGASGKVGRVLVPLLAREGVRCVCQYFRGEEIVRELAGEVERLKGEAFADEEEKRFLTPFFVRADLREREGVERLFAEVDAVGGAELLIQLAGTFARTPLEMLSEETLKEQIEMNLTVPIRIARGFARRVLSRGDEGRALPHAKMIHFTDIAAASPWAEYSAYCAAKAGLEAFTKAMAKELGPRILVNAVAPGVLEGGMNEAQLDRELRRIPAGRLGRVEEVAQAVLFLLQNDYVNGQVIAVDGGRSV